MNFPKLPTFGFNNDAFIYAIEIICMSRKSARARTTHTRQKKNYGFDAGLLSSILEYGGTLCELFAAKIQLTMRLQRHTAIAATKLAITVVEAWRIADPPVTGWVAGGVGACVAGGGLGAGVGFGGVVEQGVT
jgi:hypothetical protein